mmetsp:Transcript_16793/g.41581  ORF Transcript_16793/g.41581 Transcript_16793/m.41581 type:complete len:210 (-) Transcript_16793:206-835(-)
MLAPFRLLPIEASSSSFCTSFFPLLGRPLPLSSTSAITGRVAVLGGCATVTDRDRPSTSAGSATRVVFAEMSWSRVAVDSTRSICERCSASAAECCTITGLGTGSRAGTPTCSSSSRGVPSSALPPPAIRTSSRSSGGVSGSSRRTEERPWSPSARRMRMSNTLSTSRCAGWVTGVSRSVCSNFWNEDSAVAASCGHSSTQRSASVWIL